MTGHRIVPASATPEMIRAAYLYEVEWTKQFELKPITGSRLTEAVNAALSASPSYIPSDAFFEGMARAILAKVPIGCFVTKAEADDYARAVWAWQVTAIKEGM